MAFTRKTANERAVNRVRRLFAGLRAELPRRSLGRFRRILAGCNLSRYNQNCVIKSFRHKGLKRLFETGERRGVAGELADRLRRRLDVLNRARSTRDLNLPGYRLHRLKGNRADTWSVTVSGNWRVTFTFEGEDAFDVDLEDYH